MSMITATTWVPRGSAAEFPTKYDLNEEEFDRIAQLAKLQLDDAKLELRKAKHTAKHSPTRLGADEGSDSAESEVDEDLKEYDLEHYDDPLTEHDEDGDDSMSIFGNIKSLAYHDDHEEDPYITLDSQEDDDEERDELQILAKDNLVLAARVEDEVAHLEIYVYEDDADNLYVHHDVMLPAVPLAVEWLDLPVARATTDENARGNFVAVGTMDPDIEIWDLDVVDCMYPNAILGQGANETIPPKHGKTEGNNKLKKRAKKPNDHYHVDAVLSLAANRRHRNLLASSSADMTVKLWDLNTTTCAKSYRYHTDKVCSIAWHPEESAALLSGSYDQTVVATDMRGPEQGIRRWTLDSDVENVQWNPHDTNHFYVSTESGLLYYFDARVTPIASKASNAIWKLQAHDTAVSSFDINPVVPGYLATGSTDKRVKLWDTQGNKPSMIVARDLGVGKVFSTTFAPDVEVGFRLAVAGSKGALQVWDTSTNTAVRRAFASRLPTIDNDIHERTIGLQQNDSEDDEESGDVEESKSDIMEHSDGKDG